MHTIYEHCYMMLCVCPRRYACVSCVCGHGQPATMVGYEISMLINDLQSDRGARFRPGPASPGIEQPSHTN